MADYFVHRVNPDTTVDSICLVCFKTVCKQPTVALAKECEDKHICPGPLSDHGSVKLLVEV